MRGRMGETRVRALLARCKALRILHNARAARKETLVAVLCQNVILQLPLLLLVLLLRSSLY